MSSWKRRVKNASVTVGQQFLFILVLPGFLVGVVRVNFVRDHRRLDELVHCGPCRQAASSTAPPDLRQASSSMV